MLDSTVNEALFPSVFWGGARPIGVVFARPSRPAIAGNRPVVRFKHPAELDSTRVVIDPK